MRFRSQHMLLSRARIMSHGFREVLGLGLVRLRRPDCVVCGVTAIVLHEMHGPTSTMSHSGSDSGFGACSKKLTSGMHGAPASPLQLPSVP